MESEKVRDARLVSICSLYTMALERPTFSDVLGFHRVPSLRHWDQSALGLGKSKYMLPEYH